MFQVAKKSLRPATFHWPMMPACIKFPKAQDLTIETTITTSRLLANRSFALGETERSFLWETAGITCPARAIAWRRLKTTSARSTLQLRELLKKRGPCWVGAGTGSGLGLERVNQPTRFKKKKLEARQTMLAANNKRVNQKEKDLPIAIRLSSTATITEPGRKSKH
jgi:hypothetical protein